MVDAICPSLLVQKLAMTAVVLLDYHGKGSDGGSVELLSKAAEVESCAGRCWSMVEIWDAITIHSTQGKMHVYPFAQNCIAYTYKHKCSNYYSAKNVLHFIIKIQCCSNLLKPIILVPDHACRWLLVSCVDWKK